MIVYPLNWEQIGKAITLEQVDGVMYKIISELDCCNLSLSGGVDSSLLLYYMLENKKEVRAFTVVNDNKHPDSYYSQSVISYFEKRYNKRIPHQIMVISELTGDNLVRAYYKELSSIITDIIVGDCIDELACGYYAHQDIKEETYQDHLLRLQKEHLIPLDENSGDVKVYLPYADDRIANLFYRMPIYKKVSVIGRKLIVTKLADGKVPQCCIERKKYGFATDIQ